MEYCMTKECTKAYLEKLKGSIAEYMAMPVNLRSTEAIGSMVECWERLKGMYDMVWADETEHDHECTFTDVDAMAWNEDMMNSDGSKGGHWSIADTSSVGKPDNVTDWEWNVVMNMMYSDYSDVANRYGVGFARFYADMARAFLNDMDANKDKLARYYHYIVNAEK